MKEREGRTSPIARRKYFGQDQYLVGANHHNLIAQPMLQSGALLLVLGVHFSTTLCEASAPLYRASYWCSDIIKYYHAVML